MTRGRCHSSLRDQMPISSVRVVVMGLLTTVGTVTGCSGISADPVDPPAYNVKICAGTVGWICVPPEGLPRRLHPDDPAFVPCLEWAPADVLPRGRKGRMEFEIVRDEDGVVSAVELECGLPRTLTHGFSYDDEGRFVRWDDPAVPEATDPWGTEGWPATTYSYEYEGAIPARRILRTGEGEDLYEQTDAVSYDERGFLARVQNDRGGYSTRLVHDADGQLARADYHSNPETPDTVVSYSYEEGRLTGVESVTTFPVPGTVTATLEWEGAQLAGVRTSADSGLETELAMIRDEQGRVSERELRTADGELIARTTYAYDEAGELTAWSYWGYHDVSRWGTEEW